MQPIPSDESAKETPVDTENTSESEARNNEKRKSKNKSNVSLVISSDDEEIKKDFAPMDLRILGATNVGALGIDCLTNIEQMRAKCKNIPGGISGKMKKELERAKEMINTLIEKSEATGDPTFLKLKNKELNTQIEKYKKKEILRNKEMKELRDLVEELKKEVIDLRGRLDDAEEEERKAIVSKKITQSKLRKLRAKDGEGISETYDTEEKGTETEEMFFNLPDDGKLREKRPRLESNNEDAGWSNDDKPVNKERNMSYETSINKQIRDLIRKSADVTSQ